MQELGRHWSCSSLQFRILHVMETLVYEFGLCLSQGCCSLATVCQGTVIQHITPQPLDPTAGAKEKKISVPRFFSAERLFPEDVPRIFSTDQRDFYTHSAVNTIPNINTHMIRVI